MRVLIVSPGIYVYGGAEVLIVRLANYMTRHGIENGLLTTAMLTEMERNLEGTRIILQKRRSLPLGLGEALALHGGMRANLGDYDVINLHNYPAEFAAWRIGKPMVWMCNEPILHLLAQSSPSVKSRLFNRLRLKADRCVVRRYVKNAVVADEFNARRFERVYGLKPHIINYGIDRAFFSAGKADGVAEKYNFKGKFAVIQTGAVQPFKNQLESIKTVERLAGRIPGIKLLLVGLRDGDYIQSLQAYIREKRLENYVAFTGHLSREEVRGLYHAADLALFPIKEQGGWLSPFEALSAGLPVIVSNAMTAASLVREKGLGTVTDDYESSVMAIYSNPARYRAQAQSASAWIEANLTWDAFCRGMVNTFEEVRQR